MDDALVVGELQRVADLRDDRQGLLGRQFRARISCRRLAPSTYSIRK